MLAVVEGDLFESPAQTLVNAVNTVGEMGKGIAGQFKARYPDMFARYAEICASGAFDIGNLLLYPTPGKWILNFPTKKHYRHASQLEFIEAGLKKFVAKYEEAGISSIAFPKLGCGNGGLRWEDVWPLMERYLRPLPIAVFIHVLPNEPAIVPEHIEHEALEAEESITFSRFLEDVLRVVDDDPKRVRSLLDDEDDPLIVISSGALSLEISRDELFYLWRLLRARRALPRSECDRLFEVLVRLDYLKPMPFTGDAPPGIRYAPPRRERHAHPTRATKT